MFQQPFRDHFDSNRKGNIKILLIHVCSSFKKYYVWVILHSTGDNVFWTCVYVYVIALQRGKGLLS